MAAKGPIIAGSHTLVVTEVRKGVFDWDHRGVWTLPWPGSAVLAADIHHHLQPGESWSQVNLIPRYIPDPQLEGLRPNSQDVTIGDTLFLCLPQPAIGQRMPCADIGAFMAAAPRSFHENGVNASALDCSIRLLANDIDTVVYANLIYTRDGNRLQDRKEPDDRPGTLTLP